MLKYVVFITTFILLWTRFACDRPKCLQKDSFADLSYKDLELKSFDAQPKENLTEEEFAYDVRLLRYALDRAYSAKGLLSNDIFTKVDCELKSIKYTSSSEELWKKVGKILSQFPDRHLGVELLGKGRFFTNQPSNFVNVGKNLNDTKEVWKGIESNEGIYTIAISRCKSGDWPGFQKFVEKAIKNAHKAIILDLRGNSGGATPLKFIKTLSGQPLSPPYLPIIYRNTPETLMLDANRLKYIKLQENDPNVSIAMDKHLIKNKVKLAKALKGEIKEYCFDEDSEDMSEKKYESSKAYQGKIIILQDRRTASAAEDTILHFEKHPQVTKIGTNTGGYLHFGDLGLLILPHSKLIICPATTYYKFADGRFIEFKGIDPDIRLKDGEDAYEKALEFIRKS